MVSDRIEEHIHSLAQKKQLKPGDKLPGYMELAKKFNTSYLTVQRTIKKLEQQGVIKVVHGVGSFLNGGEELKVDLYLTPSTFDFETMQEIVDAISQENDLHLKITLKDRYTEEFTPNVPDHRVVISEVDTWRGTPGNLMDFSIYPDYKDFKAQFNTCNSECSNMQIPFYLFTYQGAVNPELLKEIGFEDEIREFRDFGFWDELKEKCRRKGVTPALKTIAKGYLWSFPPFVLSTLLMMQERKNIGNLFNLPYFDSKTGRKLFDILADFETVGVQKQKRHRFLSGAVATELNLGSWVTVQYKKKYQLKDNQLRIVPLMCGQQKIVHYHLTRLECFVNQTVSAPEKERIWFFLKELLSKRIQKKLVAQTGALSPRRDMTRNDHAWAKREDFRFFFPEKGDYLITQEFFSQEKYAALSALYEFYETHRNEISQDSIRQFMDMKLATK